MCIRDREWVRVAEDAREQQDDERVATGLESLRMAVGELVPVSYTHLDVYKRQPAARPDRSGMRMSRSMMSGWCSLKSAAASAPFVPVSYTHLGQRIRDQFLSHLSMR